MEETYPELYQDLNLITFGVHITKLTSRFKGKFFMNSPAKHDVEDFAHQ